MNSRAWARPFCPTVASRTSSTSCGAPSTSRAATRRILSSSVIRFTRVCSRPGGVDQHDVALARLAGGDRVEHDRRRIGAGPRADDVDAGARRPDLELLDGRGAKRVGGANQRRLARVLDQPRELADGRRLAGAVDADDHARRAADGRSARADSAPRRMSRISSFTSVAQRLAAAALALRTASTICSVAATPTSAEISASSSASIVSTSIGCAALCRLVGALRRPRRSVDELLLGPRERLFDLVEKTHVNL